MVLIMKRLMMILMMLPTTATAAEYTDVDVTWLAKNVYFEARNQGIAGQLAVASVTLNRVADRRFPNTIKEVVTQSLYRNSWRDGTPIPIKHKCQFSWWCDGKPDTIHDWKTYNKIKKLMLTFTTNRSIIDITEGATHYHADYVFPDWAATKLKTIEIEDHKFYRWE
ncbi:cell wall hydrolase [bacterium]|nr:cell wall hydrolase [bacterium]|tara:strand:- start:19444 stop:19944 length:501 start_codon:yes stop_codon:yes gene_type:complete